MQLVIVIVGAGTDDTSIHILIDLIDRASERASEPRKQQTDENETYFFFV